jgi:hypothetical protein
MTRIGNRTHARLASELHSSEIWDNPEFVPLGSGASRVAFLHKSTDVVYKCPRWPGVNLDQIAEVRRAKHMAKVFANSGYVRIPKASAYNVNNETIVAMEYIRGKMLSYGDNDECMRGRVELYLLGKFSDMHNENYIIDDDDMVVPIDLGSSRRGSLGPDYRLIDGIPNEFIEFVKRELNLV